VINNHTKLIQMRTCITCKKSNAKRVMLRFVRANDGLLVFDAKSKAPSRGAYTCALEFCLKKAIEKKLFKHAFKVEVLMEYESLIDEVRSLLEKNFLRSLGLSYKAGKCILGKERVLNAINEESILCVILSLDLALRVVNEVKKPVSMQNIKSYSLFSKSRLAEALGKKEVGIVAITDNSIGHNLLLDLNRIEKLQT
jgi:predicted RNA-binding protein YlxR (DUF448 family)